MPPPARSSGAFIDRKIGWLVEVVVFLDNAEAYLSILRIWMAFYDCTETTMLLSHNKLSSSWCNDVRSTDHANICPVHNAMSIGLLTRRNRALSLLKEERLCY